MLPHKLVSQKWTLHLCVCTVASQLRGVAVCHNYNYVCWKDLTEGEVCLVPLMVLKLRTSPLVRSFKQT